MKNFESLGLSEDLMTALNKMKYHEPTPIQKQSIPAAMRGRDVLGTAQTGTGKTAAFAIPLVEGIMRSPDGNAIVLTPTRELAKQVLEVIHDLLAGQDKINTAFIIGGESMQKQLNQLRRHPRIIVGTPGRINDHLERGTLKLNNTSFMVLDETDRMLDMGFGVQLDRIVKYLPKERQTLMFSATLPKEIVKLSNKYLNNPERISVGETNVVAINIEQEVIRIEQGDKYKELQIQLTARTGSVIVFVKTKYNADKMAKKLRQDGFTADALHGDLRQNKRDKVMNNFRVQNFRILVATDIAARGLDVPHIEHVVNYDLPQVAEDFIHRMGRTARAGAQGSAVSFVSSLEGRKWHAIEVLLDPSLAKNSNSHGQKFGAKKSFKGKGKGKGKKPYGKAANANHSKFDGAGEGNKKPFKKRFKAGEKAEGGHKHGDKRAPIRSSDPIGYEDQADSKFKKKSSGKPFHKKGKPANGGQGKPSFNAGKTAGKPSGKPMSKAGGQKHVSKRTGSAKSAA